MRSVLFALIACAACHHDTAQFPQQAADPVPTAATNEDIDHLPADPTLPSWAPNECKAYHDAVIRFAECDAVSQESRNVVKTQYDTDDARWKAMHETPPGQLELVRGECLDAFHDLDRRNTCLKQNQSQSAQR